MRWSAPRSPSSRRRCRRPACPCAASRSAAETEIVFVDTPGIFKPRRPSRPRHGDFGLGRGCRRRRHGADRRRARSRGAAGGSGRARHLCDRREAEGERRQGGARAQQDRRHEAHRSLAADRKAQRRGGVRTGVPDLRPQGGRCRGSGRVVRRAHAAGPVAVSGGPDRRHHLAPARRRDHARRRSICACTTSFPMPPPSRRRSGRSARTARSRSTRRSSSSAYGQKAIVLGKGGATIKKIGELSRMELEEIFGPPRASVPVREGARELGGKSASTIARWAWSFRRSDYILTYPPSPWPGLTRPPSKRASASAIESSRRADARRLGGRVKPGHGEFAYGCAHGLV